MTPAERSPSLDRRALLAMLGAIGLSASAGFAASAWPARALGHGPVKAVHGPRAPEATALPEEVPPPPRTGG